MPNFNCPHCDQLIQADDASAGQTANCPACHGNITVPAAAGGKRIPLLQPSSLPSVPEQKTLPQLQPSPVGSSQYSHSLPPPSAPAASHLPQPPPQNAVKPPLTPPNTNVLQPSGGKNSLPPPTVNPWDHGFKSAAVFKEPKYKIKRHSMFWEQIKPALLGLVLTLVVAFIVGMYISGKTGSWSEISALLQQNVTLQKLSMAGLWQVQGMLIMALPVAAVIALLRKAFGHPFFKGLVNTTSIMLLLISGIAVFGHVRTGSSVTQAGGVVKIVSWRTIQDALAQFRADFTNHLASMDKKPEPSVSTPKANQWGDVNGGSDSFPDEAEQDDSLPRNQMPPSFGTSSPSFSGTNIETTVLKNLKKDALSQLEKLQTARLQVTDDGGAEALMTPAFIGQDADLSKNTAIAQKMLKALTDHESRLQAISATGVAQLNGAVLSSNSKANILRAYHQQVSPAIELVREDLKMEAAAGGVALKMIDWLKRSAGTWRIKEGKLEVDPGKDFKFYYLLQAELDRCRARQSQIRTQLAQN